MDKTRQSANLVSENNIFSDITNNGVGIGITTPTEKLQVIGNANISGILTATSFVGNLTGTATGLSGTPNINVGIATASSFVGNLTGTATGLSGTPNINVGILTATTASISGNVTVGGNVSIAGTLTYEDVTNVDSIGLVTARSGVNVTGGSVVISSGGLTVSGVTTVAAGSTSAPSVSPTGDNNTGIFFPSADTIAFAEGGAEAARFNSSGNLLVGTTSDTGTSSQRLQVSGGAYVSGNLGIGSTNPVNKLQVTGGNIAITGSTSPSLFLVPTSGSSYTFGSNTAITGGGIYDSTGGAWRLLIKDTTGNVLINNTSETGTSSQPLQVTGGGYFSGNVGIGTTNPNGISAQTSQLAMAGSNAGGGAGYHQFLTVSNTTATNPNKFFRLNSTGSIEIVNSGYTSTIFTFANSGDFTATGNVTGYSDETLKDNIQTITDALDKVNQLRGVEFDRKDIEGNPHNIGVIAQEVEKVIPEVVMTNGDGIKSVAYGNLVGLLIEAIKELKEEVNELKARLEGI